MSLWNQVKDSIIYIFATFDWIFFLADKVAQLDLAASEFTYPFSS